MRTPPPFLILASLLFWGWQSGLLIEGAIMGLVLEAARLTTVRWDLADGDFNRIFGFCILLNVVLFIYVFSANDEGGGFSALFHGDSGRTAANSANLSYSRVSRWLPMTLFPFLVAQYFNIRESVPLTAVSIVLGWRRRRGDRTFAGAYLNISYPYFMLCLFSAGIHSNDGTHNYFLGACPLVGWALWSLKPGRFHYTIWLMALTTAVCLGFLGQFGIGRVQVYIQNFNAQWMAKFFHSHTDPTQSITSMGQIGDLKLSPKIIIWLQPEQIGKVPPYLREASYRTYRPTRETWITSHMDFEQMPPEPDTISWILFPNKETNTSLVNITCYLDSWSQELSAPEGLLPLPTGTRWIGNAPENLILKKNHNGAVLAAGRGLMTFDARYAPGATLDAGPDTTNHTDLVVPPEENRALNEVTNELKLPADATDEAKLVAVEKFFMGNFKYSTWQGPDKLPTTNATALTRFLLTSRSGHCEYFATATVLLLRKLGIPARYAVGYYAHEPSGSGYVVRERDAHAWCLEWDKATHSWVDFDTTPASWVSIESRRSSFMEWLSDLRSWIGLQIAKFRWSQAHLQQYLLWSLTPVMVVLLYYIIFRRSGRKRVSRNKNDDSPVVWPGLDSEFYQLEKQLAAQGIPRETGEPLSQWLERISAEPALTRLRGSLQQLLHLHYRHRFDPQGLSSADREQLKRETLACLASLHTAKPG